MPNQPTDRLKFYADAPDGTANKYLTYPMYDFEHSISTLNKFLRDGWRIRSAYHEYADKHSVKISLSLLDATAAHHFHQRREMEHHWEELKKLQGKG